MWVLEQLLHNASNRKRAQNKRSGGCRISQTGDAYFQSGGTNLLFGQIFTKEDGVRVPGATP